ncbi:class I SAM-dependent methyltransferase [Epilithonimonas arachidiradicis]|uniref:Methyltransferase family protein n=1 Tax=Epilithonimonas arachidiradicis TaxID=1617282 RepID=A0A420D8F2_9FLAO|nr:class I SAM-dependent methyltransferase [Epilithonimonas arachidiradicis]RKE87154.1 methyltransferase family protein [Epilithonimonas arachidiradicis]GGG58663.1 type 12 methyltransferase [Epilithonimonas arachidiradicis]
MNAEDNYLEINRESWNTRTEAHINSDFYNLDAFLKGKNSLKDIELNLLGDLTGKSVLHLQCHFGQDSISLSRLGADVVGVDLSDVAIDRARELAKQSNVSTTFICSDVYDLPNHLDRQFDIVFTSYGTIGWLPDLDRWAKIISKFLKPGGRFVFVEFHPVVWMFDSGFKKIEYRYFNSGAIIETEKGTYADKNAEFEVKSIGWNHGLAEVIGSLMHNGLEMTSIEEFDYSPYNNFNNSIEFEPGKFRIAHLGDKIPMVYALTASKNHLVDTEQ